MKIVEGADARNGTKQSGVVRSGRLASGSGDAAVDVVIIVVVVVGSGERDRVELKQRACPRKNSKERAAARSKIDKATRTLERPTMHAIPTNRDARSL